MGTVCAIGTVDAILAIDTVRAVGSVHTVLTGRTGSRRVERSRIVDMRGSARHIIDQEALVHGGGAAAPAVRMSRRSLAEGLRSSTSR